MILPDTSVWADHFRHPEFELETHYAAGLLVMHPLIIGELALGYLKRRVETLTMLRSMRPIRHATEAELLGLIEERELMGRGIGLIDAHLLASAHLAGEVWLWTRDKRLRRAAQEFDLLADLD